MSNLFQPGDDASFLPLLMGIKKTLVGCQLSEGEEEELETLLSYQFAML